MAGGAIIALYLINELFNKLGKGVSNVKDIVGAGDEAKKADILISKIKDNKLNVFNPSYLKTYMKENAGKKILLVTPKSKKAIVDKIIKNLSYSQTFLTPFKFKENREAVVNTIIDGVKTKTQMADIANDYFKRTGKNLLDELNKGFRKTSTLTGAEIERLFATLLNYIYNLKN